MFECFQFTADSFNIGDEINVSESSCNISAHNLSNGSWSKLTCSSKPREGENILRAENFELEVQDRKMLHTINVVISILSPLDKFTK